MGKQVWFSFIRYITLPFVLQISIVVGQQSVFDRQIPEQKIIQTSLKVVKQLILKNKLTANEIRQFYFAEKQIGRCVLAPTTRDSALYGDYLFPFNYFQDTLIKKECLAYIKQYRNRFRVVFDGWKGEENFLEPTGHWVDMMKKYYPNSTQGNEIEFDLDFNALIRRFTIDEEAKGKSCQQYYEEELKNNLEMYLEVFSKEEIGRWPSDCAIVREDFMRMRSELLKKYKYAPFTKILQDIDPTTIVVHHSVC